MTTTRLDRFKYALALLTALFGSSGVALADSPSPSDVYRGKAKKLPAYDSHLGAPHVNKNAAPTRTACGYLDYTFRSVSLGGGEWSSVEFVGRALDRTVDPVEVTDCKFPQPNPKYGKLLTQARSGFTGLTAADVLTVPPGVTWQAFRPDDGSAPFRTIAVRHYAKAMNFTVTDCGVQDRSIVCEESGSKAAYAYNVAKFRSQQAATFVASHDDDSCQAAAWDVIRRSRGLVRFRDKVKAKGHWRNGATYMTRNDGNLSEAQLFSKMADLEQDALAKWKWCGGPATVPIDQYSLDEPFPTGS